MEHQGGHVKSKGKKLIHFSLEPGKKIARQVMVTFNTEFQIGLLDVISPLVCEAHTIGVTYDLLNLCNFSCTLS